MSDAISNDTYNITVQLKTSATLNPDNNGRPSPLYVKIFQLKDESSFQKLTLDELLFLQKTAFASNDILAVDETTLLPSTTKELELSINSDATYLGILAAFQREAGKFKQAIKVEGKWNRDLCISLAESDIESVDLC